MDYVDLNQIAAEYLKIENERHILPFKKEIEKLQTLSDSSEMVYNYGIIAKTTNETANLN